MFKRQYEVTPEGWIFFIGLAAIAIVGIYTSLTSEPEKKPEPEPQKEKKKPFIISNIPFYEL